MNTNRGYCALVAGAWLLSCSNSHHALPGADGGRTSSPPGTLPAELRDLEQASEDLIAVAFGQLPDRKADWSHAATLEAALKQRWSKVKANVKGLPNAAVTEIDAALVSLDSTVPAQQQKQTAEEAIAIFGVVPELFALFPSDVPTQVVHMDALGMQVAVEGHFSNFSAADAARQSLSADWTAVKAQVEARVTTCTRVQGASTVVTDFDAWLAGIDTSIAAKDALMTEQYAENVLVVVDTLELLFNCPVGNEPPAHGLGSRCAKTAECDSDQVCDSANSGGRCAPDPARVSIGKACTSSADCGNDHRVVCASEAGDGFPNGYCIMEPCDDIQLCPPGNTCVTLGAETPACFKSCMVDADCRASDGYVCQFFEYACSFPCTRDADCLMPLTCNVATGKCKA
jgi:hypothetical protein